jgi:hypothetical protein
MQVLQKGNEGKVIDNSDGNGFPTGKTVAIYAGPDSLQKLLESRYF